MQASTAFSEDALNRTQQQLLIRLGTLWLLIGIVPLIWLWTSAADSMLGERLRPTVNGLVYLFGCALMIVLARLRHLKTAALVICVTQLLMLLVAAFWVGFGVRAVAFANVPILISFICFFYGTRAGTVAGVLSVGLVLGVFGLQTTGLISSATALFQPLVMTTLAILIAAYVGLSLIYHHYGTLVDLTLGEIQRSSEKTACALSALQIAENNRATFLATLSHSFRTPITGIRMAQDILRNPKANAAFKQRAVANLRLSTRKLQTLVAQLRDASELARGVCIVGHETFNFRYLLETVCNDYRTEARQKGIDLNAFIDQSIRSDEWTGDPQRIAQMLGILLDNAIKYQTGGRIELSASLSTQAAGYRSVRRFEVRDEGPGVPQDAETQLFIPFGQLAVHVNNLTEGSGLGLAVLKGLSESMGGACGFERRQTKGSVFWFELPEIHFEHTTASHPLKAVLHG